MTTAIMQSQQVAVVLSLDVIDRKDTGTRTLSVFFVNLTPVLFWLLSLWQRWMDFTELVDAVADLIDAALMAGATVVALHWNVFVIIAKSVAFGVGLKL